MRGLSIGYRIVKVDYPRGGKLQRILRDVDLHEISVVDQPPDEDARIASVRSRDAADLIARFRAMRQPAPDDDVDQLMKRFQDL
jgi:phage head maturation protease